MKKKTTAMARPETLINPFEEDKIPKIHNGYGFYACYLLTSLCPRFKGHTYIGFTVNPKRRIRQHNGEIRSGAFRTKKRRPWEMVLCIYGFPTNVSALQFEWAWQHPTESLEVREAAAAFKSFSGVANKIKLAYTMLNLAAWNSLNITVNYLSTKYWSHSGGCPSLPNYMKVQVVPMDELPCYSHFSDDERFRSGSADHSPVSKVDYDSTLARDGKLTLTGQVDEGEASLKRCNVSYETEVIDLLSPSPDCRIVSERNKRRRLSTTCFPVIIDLT